MIVGNGMIASIFKKYLNNSNIIIFASGVSDSTEENEVEFLRERRLLEDILDNNHDKKFIYFSSCSLEDNELKDTPYHIHKKSIEEFIQKNVLKYIIFRLPNVIGYIGNERTIINFFTNQIKEHNKFIVWKNATRNIIDIEDMYEIVSYIIDNDIYLNEIINIAYNENISVSSIILAIEDILEMKGDYIFENKGVDMKIDNKKIQTIFNKLHIKQPNIKSLIKKYKGLD